ncbi:MAG: EamA family transporter, partial [Clostridium sp.]
IFSWIMVGIAGSWKDIGQISSTTFIFLILSGLSTGASWLFYFKALQIGNINKVAAVDKTSVVLTIILSFIFFQEPINLYKIIGILGITIGTYMMLEKKESNVEEKGNRWFLYAILSVIFASMTTILGKIGITDIESNLGTAIRTSVVLIMAWMIVFITNNQNTLKHIPKREYIFLCLSGLATGCSWLCFYRALQIGPASLVTPIDKLSIVVTVVFSHLVLHEKVAKKAWIGLFFIVSGTLLMLFY